MKYTYYLFEFTNLRFLFRVYDDVKCDVRHLNHENTEWKVESAKWSDIDTNASKLLTEEDVFALLL